MCWKNGIGTNDEKTGSTKMVPVSHLLVPVPIEKKRGVHLWY